MKRVHKPVLVASATKDAVFIFPTGEQKGRIYNKENVQAHVPEPKKADRELRMAYSEFVLSRGRFNPAGMVKYMDFRGKHQSAAGFDKGRFKAAMEQKKEAAGISKLINRIIHQMPSNTARMHRFEFIPAH